ncbi:MAG: putative esterase, partial [Verrucomicrobia bacterium]|nr:putative esterase [Verrucomicrobiota bacterium]
KVVNMSTRGEVRTADSIMIAGFVITGNVPKRVLIRGVGPTLAGFGVPDSLLNPIVKLYLGQTLVATNNDWGTGGDAATLSTVAAQIGAFPLDTGSKDSVILITLAPGIYSAQVSGVGGTTGVVLLEVYEVP